MPPGNAVRLWVAGGVGCCLRSWQKQIPYGSLCFHSCVCVLIWVHHPEARFAECFGAFRNRLYNFLKKPSFCWWVVQPNKKGGAWVLKPECLMLSYAKQPRWKKAAPWQDVAVWGAQTWLSINVKFSMVTWYLHTCILYTYNMFMYVNMCTISHCKHGFFYLWLAVKVHKDWCPDGSRGNNSTPFCCSFCKRSCANSVYSFPIFAKRERERERKNIFWYIQNMIEYGVPRSN